MYTVVREISRANKKAESTQEMCAKKRVCKKVKSNCTLAGVRAALMQKSPAKIAEIAGVGLRTPSTKKKRTKKTLVGLAIKKKKKATLGRWLGITFKRKAPKRSKKLKR